MSLQLSDTWLWTPLQAPLEVFAYLFSLGNLSGDELLATAIFHVLSGPAGVAQKKMNEPSTNGQDCHRVYEPGSLLGASAKRVVGKCGGLISCWNPLAIIREDDKGCLFAFSIILIDSEMQISMRKRSQLLNHQSQHKSCFYCILSFGHHKSQVTWCPLQTLWWLTLTSSISSIIKSTRSAPTTK